MSAFVNKSFKIFPKWKKNQPACVNFKSSLYVALRLSRIDVRHILVSPNMNYSGIGSILMRINVAHLLGKIFISEESHLKCDILRA